MKIAVFWNVASYVHNPAHIYGRFGGTCYFHHLGRALLFDSPLNINQFKRRHFPEDGKFNKVFLQYRHNKTGYYYKRTLLSYKNGFLAVTFTEINTKFLSLERPKFIPLHQNNS
jgi:hypothetical protein